jgi:hypothetical protein
LEKRSGDPGRHNSSSSEHGDRAKTMTAAVAVAPEGIRSRSGRRLRYKPGFAPAAAAAHGRGGGVGDNMQYQVEEVGRAAGGALDVWVPQWGVRVKRKRELELKMSGSEVVFLGTAPAAAAAGTGGGHVERGAGARARGLMDNADNLSDTCSQVRWGYHQNSANPIRQNATK